VSIWQWIRDYYADAEATGDPQRLRLCDLHQDAMSSYRTNPDRTLAMLAEARALAEQMGENWWVLFIDHWRLQALLNFKLDFRHVLDIAVGATLEARKPQYASFPQRICLHEDLISSYLGIDPFGYAGAVMQALDYMEHEVSPDVECRFCQKECRAEFARVCGDLDGVERVTRLELDLLDADEQSGTSQDHHLGIAYLNLCNVAFLRRDWETLRELIPQTEVLALRRENHLGLARLLYYQALLARLDGDESAAKRLMRRGRSREQRAGGVPGEQNFDALAGFHEAGGELEEAWQVREQELATLLDRGHFFDEFVCRRKRLRLLVQMGKPHDEELALARAAAGKLREPGRHLEELERAIGGSPS
jgi:hypothetical protein